jgi:hypothetical protein
MSKERGVDNYYKLIHWPDSQKFMDNEKYPEVEYKYTDNIEQTGSVFVPFKYLNEIAGQRFWGESAKNFHSNGLPKENGVEK